MERIFKTLSILLSLLLVLNSCNVKKAVVKKGETVLKHNDLINRINTISNKQEIIFLKGSKISIDDNSSLTNLKANFLIKKDSAILVSISSLMGIEVSRAMILKDSIIVIDRINKTYYKEKYEELEKKFSIALDYQQLQNVLTADFKTEINRNIKKEDTISIDANRRFRVIVQNKDNPVDIIETVLQIDPSSFYVNQTTILYDKKKQEYEILYSDYLNLGDYLYPGFIELEFKNRKSQIKIAIQNRNVKFQTDKRIEISIPANYERIKTSKNED